MGARVRVQRRDYVNSQLKWYGHISNGPYHPSFIRRTEDVTGRKPYVDQPFYSKRVTKSGMMWSKGWSDGDYLRGAAIPYILEDFQPWNINPEDYINRILAQTGPLTPRINLPLFVYELKDIPDMLKHAGDLLHKLRNPRSSRLAPTKEAAAATLAYQFGWGPLTQDLMKLIDFGSAVVKQRKLLRGARSEKGLRRRIQLDNGAIQQDDESYMGSAGSHVWSTTVKRQREFNAWATIRWKITDPDQMGHEPDLLDVWKTALGLKPGMIPIDIWKGLPWSWFADWFLDISNILQANYNTLYYTPSNVNIMVTTTERHWYDPIIEPDGTTICSAGYVEAIIKTRRQYPAHTSVRLRLPMVDDFKLSILGSMTILGLYKWGK